MGQPADKDFDRWVYKLGAVLLLVVALLVTLAIMAVRQRTQAQAALDACAKELDPCACYHQVNPDLARLERCYKALPGVRP